MLTYKIDLTMYFFFQRVCMGKRKRTSRTKTAQQRAPGPSSTSIYMWLWLVQVCNPDCLSFSCGINGCRREPVHRPHPDRVMDSLAFLLMFNLTSRCKFNKLVSRSASQHFRLRELIPIKFIRFFQHKELIASFNLVSAVLYIGIRG
jgi:hypothetical protein